MTLAINGQSQDSSDGLPHLSLSESPTSGPHIYGIRADVPESRATGLFLPDSPSRAENRASMIEAWRARDKPRAGKTGTTQAELVEGKEDQEDLRRTNAQLQEEVAQLRSRLDSLRDEGSSLRSQFTVVEASKSVTTTVLHDITKQVLTLQARNVELEGHLAAQTQELDELMASRSNEAEKAYAQAQALTRQVEDLKDFSIRLQAQLANADAELHTVKAKEAEHAASTELLLQELVAVKGSHAEYHVRHEADQAALRSLSAALLDMTQAVDSLKKQLESCDQNEAELRADLEAKEDLIAQQEGDILKLDDLIAAITGRNQSAGSSKHVVPHCGLRRALCGLPVWLVKTGVTVAATLAVGHEVHRRQLNR